MFNRGRGIGNVDLATLKVLFDVDTQFPSIRDLARRSVAASPRGSDPHAPVPLINENLRHDLVQLVGAEGLASLVRRALVLAGAQVPALQGANVGKDGRLEGGEPLLAQAATAQELAALAVTAQLLELLIAFIGESLTRRIVLEACPESPLNK